MRVGLTSIRTHGVRVLGPMGAAIVLAVGGLLVAPGSEEGEVQAFSQAWRLIRCQGTESSSHRALLDDAPGAGKANDAAFAYVSANDTSTEYCIWGARVPVESSGHYARMTVRAAANDGTMLVVYVRTNIDCEGGSNIGSVWFGDGGDAPADNGFFTRNEDLSAGVARSVCIRVQDTDASESRRVSALLDAIALRRASSAIGWREDFSRTN